MNSAEPPEQHDADDLVTEALVDFDFCLERERNDATTDSLVDETPRGREAAVDRGIRALRLLEAVRKTAPEILGDVLEEPRESTGQPEQSDVAPADIGRFRIERQLGRGGYGIVFLAFDPVLKRRVALKVPHPEALVAPELRRRFLREAEAAAALNHPNIVPIYETGRDGPVCYIASAYCNGPSLSEWLDRHGGRADPSAAAMIVAQLADAVQHAHSRGVLHRDIKPSNVLCAAETDPEARHDDSEDSIHQSSDGESALVPQLTDFGLARLESQSGLETYDDLPRSENEDLDIRFQRSKAHNSLGIHRKVTGDDERGRRIGHSNHPQGDRT